MLKEEIAKKIANSMQLADPQLKDWDNLSVETEGLSFKQSFCFILHTLECTLPGYLITYPLFHPCTVSVLWQLHPVPPYIYLTG